MIDTKTPEMMMRRRKTAVKTGVIFVVFTFLIIIYKYINPEHSVLFPNCPFKLLTGWECPGCGSQRAIHYLLNLRINKAIQANALLVCSIPYIIMGYIFDANADRNLHFLKLRRFLYGEKAIWIILIIIILFWILRNIIK